VKIAKSAVRARKSASPELKFEDNQRMTSFGGLIVVQKLFASVGIRGLLQRSCAHLGRKHSHFYNHSTALQCLIVHLFLGFRKLRDFDYYREDPMVLDTLNLRCLPSVPTLSRLLGEFDTTAVDNLREVNRDLVLTRLRGENLRRVTVDFDGSVLSTKRHAEGSAVGFNKQKKGARSYYPLFCTIAQSGQIFDSLHRSGNVHDSNGAGDFIIECIKEIRGAMPLAQIEVRMDSAFFSDEIVSLLGDLGVEYTISVPFERFVELKGKIEGRDWWWPAYGAESVTHYFEEYWKPNCWETKARFLFIRKENKKQNKEPIQLDFFKPMETGMDYKVIVTNKKGRAGSVVKYHEGRGYQERILGEVKTNTQLSYVPCRRRKANEAYMQCAVITHNLSREMQMRVQPQERTTTAKRTVLWVFEELSTLRGRILQRAARFTWPQGRKTLTFSKNEKLEGDLLKYTVG
jgi:hypothetical protein